MDLKRWEQEMRDAIRNIHSYSAAMAKGGRKQVTFSDWGKLGANVKEEYKRLQNKVDKIEAGKAIAEGRSTLHG